MAAIIGATATLWAVGMAVYVFIYQYFQREHLQRALKMATGAIPPTPEMWVRLLQNLGVLVGYITSGLLSVLTIGASASALLDSNEALLRQSMTLFSFTLAWFFGLFTFEILTTVRQIACYLAGIEGKL